MYFIVGRQDNTLFIADTKDGIIEPVSLDTYRSLIQSGIEIKDSVKDIQITENMSYSSARSLYNYLRRTRRHISELQQYVTTHIQYAIFGVTGTGYPCTSDGLHYADYMDTQEMICVFWEYRGGTVVYIVRSDGEYLVKYVEGILRKNPTCSGYYAMRLAMLKGMDVALDESDIYAILYAKNKISFTSLTKYNETVVIANPDEIML